ncbi:MAG: hypothetical protein V8S24_05480 [Gordonibacter pamelaeae]
MLDGEIPPLASLLDRIRIEARRRGPSLRARKQAAAPRPRRPRAQARPEDLDDFAGRVAAAYRDIARRYYLEPDVQPEVRVGKDGIRIHIPVHITIAPVEKLRHLVGVRPYPQVARHTING